MYKIFFKISFLILTSFIVIGCTPFFINDSKPKAIQEDADILQGQEENNSLNKIKGFNSITQGVIWDLCPNGQEIVLLREDDIEPDSQVEDDIVNSLVLYNLIEEEIQRVTSSPVNLTLSQFDANEEGIYYLENTGESVFQLYWYDISNNVKVRISPTDHRVNPSFHVSNNNEVYYGTNDGKIIRANRSNILTTIDIGSEYYIRQIYYYEEEDLLVFSALKDEILNLYSVNLKDESFAKILSEINGSFHVSQMEDKILYTTPIPNSIKSTLWLFDFDKEESIELFEGYPHRAVFSPKGDKIAYLDRPDSNADIQNIWILNTEDMESKQVASGLKVTSQIFWHPRENRLFFSISETVEEQLRSTVYSLDFEI